MVEPRVRWYRRWDGAPVIFAALAVSSALAAAAFELPAFLLDWAAAAAAGACEPPRSACRGQREGRRICALPTR